MGGTAKGSKVSKGSRESKSLWLAPNPSKRWGEAFFLLYTPVVFTLCLGIIVPYKLYERFMELEYLILGLVSAVPCFIAPLLFVGIADSGKCLKDRYWVKANLWIVIFSYVGNYFWTHYFFTVLGASYTFPSWRMNNVPHTTFLLTHVCFLFYHVISNMTLRRLRHAISGLPKSMQFITEASWILALSYFIAYLETVAIANAGVWVAWPRISHILNVLPGLLTLFSACGMFVLPFQEGWALISCCLDGEFPYYDFVDRAIMYEVGCLFYAIYFLVSFPMFSRIDEIDNGNWDLSRVAVDALGAAMLVTIILDLWRIFLGPIIPMSESKQCKEPGLAWFHMPESSMQNDSA